MRGRYGWECCGQLVSADVLYGLLCPTRWILISWSLGLIRSRPLDLRFLQRCCSDPVYTLLIWDCCQSDAFIVMLLASSGPANARYLPVSTTTALIKLCAPVSTLHVSDRSISGAFMLEHLSLYRDKWCDLLPHTRPWAHAFLRNDTPEQTRHNYLSWCPTGWFRMFAGWLYQLTSYTFIIAWSVTVQDQTYSNDVRNACTSVLLSMYVRMISNMLVEAGSRWVASR